MRQWLSIGQIALAFLVSIWGTVRLGEATAHTVTIDLSRPLTIESPFEILPVGDKGERGLYLRPHAGRGWKKEAGGEATYQCYAPADGQYHVWTLCRWRDACSNAIYMQMDDDREFILGNDPIYDKWHWTRGAGLALKRGTHKVRLFNHSDGVALRQLVLTTDPEQTPDGLLPVWDDLYWEGFDGCANGTFPLWEQAAGSWEVRPREARPDATEKAAIGHSTDAALLMLRVDDWADVEIHASVRVLEGASDQGYAGICFGLKSDQQFHLLQWRELPQAHAAHIRLVEHRGSDEAVLTEFRTPWPEAAWHDVRIGLRTGAIGIRFDGAQETVHPVAGELGGGIGLRLTGRVSAWFDNISIRRIRAPRAEAAR